MLRDLKLFLLLRLDAARRAIARWLLGLRFAETVAMPLNGLVLVKTHRHHEAWLDYRDAERLARKLLLIVGGPEDTAGAPVPASPKPPTMPAKAHNRVAAYFAACHPSAN